MPPDRQLLGIGFDEATLPQPDEVLQRSVSET